MAIYYDKRHKPLSFKLGDKAFITLAGSMLPGYHLQNTISHKLSAQCVGPFKVKRAVGRLTYELKLPTTWKIHSIISVAHLEPFKDDSYHRSEPPVADVIVDESGEHEEWEADEIVTERYNKGRKRNEWLIKWKLFGPEHNTWEPLDNLTNAPELLDQFCSSKNPIATGSTFFLPSPHQPPLANAFQISWR
jgi:hypothetical protein